MEEYRLVPWDSENQKPKSEVQKPKPFAVSLLKATNIPFIIAGLLFGLALNDNKYEEKYKKTLEVNKLLVRINQVDIKELEEKVKNVSNPGIVINSRVRSTNEKRRYSVKLDDYLNYINENNETVYTKSDFKKMKAKRLFDPNDPNYYFLPSIDK